MYMRQTVKYLVLLLLTLSSISFHAQETPAELTASVSKNKLGQNQRLRVVFAVNKQGADNFKKPDFKNFRIVSGPVH